MLGFAKQGIIFIADTYSVVKYYGTLIENGFTPDEAGISFYSSTPGL